VNLTPDQYMAKVKVTPEMVKQYYESHPAEFTTPETARVEYLEMSLDAVAARVPIAPDELKKTYEEEVKAGKHGSPEERKASHILVVSPSDAKEADAKAAEGKAKEIAERVRKNPKSFAEVAKKESQDPGSAPQGGDLGFFSQGAMVKPFEDAAFAAKKDEIVGPVQSEFGWHVIQVTDIKPAKVKSLAEATPEIEAGIRKGAAQRRFAELAEQFSNTVYEQPTSLKPAADAVGIAIQQSPWLSKGAFASPILNNPKLQGEIFSDATLKEKRNTSAVEVAPNVLVAARLLDHRPAQKRPFETVQADIQRRLQREEGLKLARVEGEAKLKELQEGKDAGLKWPAPLAVNRQKSGGLPPAVIDRVSRLDSKKLPAYAGVETPAGYALVQVSKVIELEKVDDAKRQGLAARLRDAVAAQEMEATLASVRERVGVQVKKDAFEKKAAAN